jgi:hypothetical protein
LSGSSYTYSGSFVGDGSGLTGIIVSGSVEWDAILNKPSGIVSSSAQLSNTTIPGNLTIEGKLTAQEFHTEYVSASIIYESGSTKFGDTSDDIHQFTGSIQQSGSNSYFLGNVGIGTTSPDTLLTLTGNNVIKFTGVSAQNQISTIQTDSSDNLSITAGIGSGKSITIGKGNRSLRLQSSAFTYGNEVHDFRDYLNVPQLYIDSTGNNPVKVGIGTTSPAYKLDVSGSGRFTNTLYVSGSDTSSATEAFKVVNSSGDIGIQVLNNKNVGIGGAAQTSDSYRLRVHGGLWADSLLQLVTLAGTAGVGSIRYYQGGATLNMDVYGPHPSEGVKGILQLRSQDLNYTTLQNSILHADPDFLDNPSFVIRSRNTDDESYAMMNYKSGSGFMLKTSEPPSSGTADITFKPSGSTVLFLSSSGDVGIGTTSPNAGLEVANAENSTLRLTRNSNNGNYLQLQGGSSGAIYNINTSGTQDHIFQTAGNEKMRLTSAGNVGIGTTSPAATLHIKSPLNFTNTGSLQIDTTQVSSTQVFMDLKGTSAYDQFIFKHYRGSTLQNWIKDDQGRLNFYTKPLSSYLGFTAFGFVADSAVTGNVISFGNSSTTHMVVSASGNVGIGTTSPTQKLHVEGTSKFVGQGTWPMQMVNDVSSGQAEMGLWTVSNAYATTKHFSLVATPINNQPVWYFQASGDGWMDMALQRYGGRVGIRTLEPSANLTVQGNGTTTGKTFLAQDSNASALFTILDNGNVGIGTTSPTSKLDVSGSGNFTDGLTVTGSINQIGDLTVDGILTAREFHTEFVSSSIIYESGSTKFGDTLDDIHSFTGSIQQSGSNSYFLGNVGIGTTSPSHKLDVAGNVLVTTSGSTQPLKTFEATYKQFSVDYPNSPSIYTTELNFGLYGRIQYNGNGGILSIVNRSTQAGSSSMRFVMGTTERMRITDTGNVGIGTTSPVSNYKLHVLGSNRTALLDNSTLVSIVKVTNSGTGNGVYNGLDFVANSTNSSNINSHGMPLVFSTSNTNGVQTTERIRITGDGNVGIGTTSPTSKLDVSGSVSIDGKIALNDGGNSVYIGDDAGRLDDGSDNRNVGVGHQALYNNTTGDRNTANGYLALYNNTTGYNNVANGREALKGNTTGYNNTSNGNEALSSNTTGISNVANGIQALYSNTTGNYNTANGTTALHFNTEGNYNVANGYRALYNNTTGDNNVANGLQALYNNTTGNNNVANGTYG